MASLRLDKLITHMGLGSRKEAAQWARQGRLTVNGRPCRAEEKVDPQRDTIALFGQPVRYQEHVYVLLYKPAGVLTATRDARQKTVLDLLPARYRRMGLFPAGRLDKDTTGLLLLTNDGDFCHRLVSPRFHVPKVYEAAVDGDIRPGQQEQFARGLVLGDGTRCLPARLEPLGAGRVRVVVQEGKYHQVKRMLAQCGMPVKALHRAAIGSLQLDAGMQPGQWRELTGEEVAGLLSGKNSP